MKKLILVAMLAIAASIYQPAKAQVSINVNIGARPYYTPSYYTHTSYYAAPRYAYYPHRNVIVHRSYVPTRYYRTYSRPQSRYYVKSYAKHGNGHFKFKGKGHGRH
jgi:hypothetical protein